MATSRPLFVNGFATTLRTAVANGTTTSFDLTSTTGLPSFGTDQFVPAVVVDTSTSPETIKEFVYITATAAGPSATVVRAVEDAATYPAGALASGLTVAAVATRNAIDESATLRERFLKPDGVQVETLSRAAGGFSDQSPLVSGRLQLMAIALPVDLVIGHIAFVTGTTAVGTPTHWWFGLYDKTGVQLAVTADQTTAAWAASTAVSLAVATTAGGAASTFTTTYTGLYYLGVMVAATTRPSLVAMTSFNPPSGVAPTLAFNSTTALTTPPAFPFTAATATANSTLIYAYVAP